MQCAYDLWRAEQEMGDALKKYLLSAQHDRPGEERRYSGSGMNSLS
jgi:hypothetical protein